MINFTAVFNRSPIHLSEPLATLQARLMDGLIQFCNSHTPSRFMILTAYEEEDYFELITDTIKRILPILDKPIGSRYNITNTGINEYPATDLKDNFAAQDVCIWKLWVEYEQLFGTVYNYKDSIHLIPGLVHKVNGGILIIGGRALTNKPSLWIQLKQIILQKRFEWFSVNNNCSLPISIPSMPLNLRLIILCDRNGLADLNNLAPELIKIALYSEFEPTLQINGEKEMIQWCGWVNMLLQRKGLPILHNKAWPTLIQQSVRYIGDQFQLPLCPQWLIRRLKEAALYSSSQILTSAAFSKSEYTRLWRESYLSKKMQDEIVKGQIMVKTEGQVIGQVNALSILDFPGHPLLFGIPTRISCVIYLGDGQINDIEQKAELSGNIHTKGIMIIKAFLMSALKIDQLLPYSASLVFEQSYEEIDGDSASLAEGVALISALAKTPINQEIAITGSVDQFGHVQPIGGVNEKIEGFFNLCQIRGLTNSQGVIFPSANLRNLCLHDDVITAVREKKFFLWAIDTINEALEIITKVPFYHDKHPNLLNLIRQHINNVHLRERKRTSWILRWLNWF